MFNIETGESEGRAGITKCGQIIAESLETKENDYWNAQNRAVLLNDSVHYIHNEEVLSAKWGSNK